MDSRTFAGALAFYAALVWAPVAGGEPPARTHSDRETAQEDELRELKRQLRVVVEELARLRTSMAVPEEPELKSTYGLGPAASRIYGVSRGLSSTA